MLTACGDRPENEDVNNLKVVFHVDKENTKEMKALSKNALSLPN
jgi:hypothetical protein